MGMRTLRCFSIESQKANVEASEVRCFANATIFIDTLQILNIDIDEVIYVHDRPLPNGLVQAYRERGAPRNPILTIIGSLSSEGDEAGARLKSPRGSLRL